MAYNFDKYRDKRERVLGVKRRGPGFGILAAFVALVIVVGLGQAVIPNVISQFQARNLDDAIYRLQEDSNWSTDITDQLSALSGVQKATVDTDGRRLLVTFNRNSIDATRLKDFFQDRSLKVILLNQMSHSVHLNTQAKERASETP